MRVVFRVDATAQQGSGHVMRCLTLAEEFRARGDAVVFVAAIDGIEWLSRLVAESGYQIVSATADTVDVDAVMAHRPDWVVVDSYRIPAEQINSLARVIDVLAVIDGSARGIEARLYLDQNLGAESEDRGALEGRVLAGASYSLIRDDILAHRRAEPWRAAEPPEVVLFMGGTDPGRVTTAVAAELAKIERPLHLSVVVPDEQYSEVDGMLSARTNGWHRLFSPTPKLPDLLGTADVVVSAAGTSAWDVCTLGVPALFIAVVANQMASLSAIRDRGLALAIDFNAGASLDTVADAVVRLVEDQSLRCELTSACAAIFDGEGKRRVVDALGLPLEASG